MISESSLRTNYSSVLHLHLIVEGTQYPLVRMGRGYVELRNPLDLPRCLGEVVMTIDDTERRWNVDIIDGAVPFDRTLRIRMLDD